MLVLVLFTDSVLYICESKNVQISGKRCSVKYNDNKKYAARVLAVCRHEKILENLQLNIEGTIEHTASRWMLVNSEGTIYTKAKQELLENADREILFVDKDILFNTQLSSGISSFIQSDVLCEQSNFFGKSSLFLRLEISSSGENDLVSLQSKRPDAEEMISSVPKGVKLNEKDPQQQMLSDDAEVICPLPEATDLHEKNGERKSSSGTQPRHALDEEEVTLPLHNNSVGQKSSSRLEVIDGNDEDAKKESLSADGIFETQTKCSEIVEESMPINTRIEMPNCGKPEGEIPLKSRHTNDEADNPVIPEDNDKNSAEQKPSIETQPSCVKNDGKIRLPSHHGHVDEETSSIPEAIDCNEKDVEKKSLPINDLPALRSNSLQLGKISSLTDDTLATKSSFLENKIKGKLQSACNDSEEGISSIRDANECNKQKIQLKSLLTDGTLDTDRRCSQLEDESSVTSGDINSNTKDSLELSERSSSALPKVSDSEENGFSCEKTTTILNLTYSLDDKIITEGDMNFHSISLSEDNLSILNQILNDMEPGVITNSNAMGNSMKTKIENDKCIDSTIDPFQYTVYYSHEHSPKDQPCDHELHKGASFITAARSDIDSNINDEEPELIKKPIKIVSDDIINLPLYNKLLTKKNHDVIENEELPGQETSKKWFQEEIDDFALKKCAQSSFFSESEDENPISPLAFLNRQDIGEDDNSNSVHDDDDDDDEDYQPMDEDPSSPGENNDQLTEGEIFGGQSSKGHDLAKSLNMTLRNSPRVAAPDDAGLTVDHSSAGAKKHFCLYCQKFIIKLARHLVQRHGNEEDVKKFSVLPPKNRERQKIIAFIRKKGDSVYNSNRNFNKGKLLPCRRPNERMGKTGKDFGRCPVCAGEYARSSLRHHWRDCSNQNGKHERTLQSSSRRMTGRIHEKAHVNVRKHIFPYLREDEVVRGIRYDELVIIYANKQAQKYGSHYHLYAMVRGKLRTLGRFLVSIKQISSGISELADVFSPRHYDSALEAVRMVAEFNPITNKFLKPTNASSLGTLLKQIGRILRSEYIKQERYDDQKKVEDFLKLMEEDYSISINRAVTETQAENHRRKEIILPSTEDVKKLYTFILAERNHYYLELDKEFSFDAWKNLAQTTLIYLQIFNRRRPGEIERLYLEDYYNHRGINEMADREIYNSLSKEGKKLANEYLRFEIRGKRGRSVPVLIDTKVNDCLKLIIKYRARAGVPDNNDYLFGLPSLDHNRLRHLTACDLMRAYSTQCGAQIPETLRGTQLRKHIATKCINLKLNESEVKDLANFMGHADKIHRDIYRQPILQTDIVNIAKLLHTAQGIDGDDYLEEEHDMSNMEPDLPAVDSMNTSSMPVGSSGSHDRFSQRSLEAGTPNRWCNEQRKIVLGAFSQMISQGKMPSGKEMQKLIDENDCLKKRTVPQLRTWLHTQKKKL